MDIITLASLLFIGAKNTTVVVIKEDNTKIEPWVGIFFLVCLGYLLLEQLIPEIAIGDWIRKKRGLAPATKKEKESFWWQLKDFGYILLTIAGIFLIFIILENIYSNTNPNG